MVLCRRVSVCFTFRRRDPDPESTPSFPSWIGPCTCPEHSESDITGAGPAPLFLNCAAHVWGAYVLMSATVPAAVGLKVPSLTSCRRFDSFRSSSSGVSSTLGHDYQACGNRPS